MFIKRESIYKKFLPIKHVLTMKKFLILTLIAGIVACSSLKTAFDYDGQADFTKYKTYQLTEDDLEATIGQLNRNRVISTLENELSAKGFSKSEEPDALVDVHIKTQQKVSATANTTGMGYGRYGRYGYGGGFSTTQINYDEYTDGTLFISLIDNATQKIVWQGTGSKTLDESTSPEKREKNIPYSIQQILKNYPPTK